MKAIFIMKFADLVYSTHIMFPVYLGEWGWRMAPHHNASGTRHKICRVWLILYSEVLQRVCIHLAEKLLGQ